MARLKWDESGTKLYETGVDRGVLFLKSATGNTYEPGVAWNGLTGVTESPSGAEDTTLWADNIKYLTLKSAEEFGLTIECYTYPDEWAECDGALSPVAGMTIGQQPRRKFGFCYRTLHGNDNEGNDAGYKLHFVYNCSASPSERAYATVNDSPDAITFSYEVTCLPETVGTINNVEYKPTCVITVDSLTVDPAKLTKLENWVYGTDGSGTTTNAQMPSPAKIYELLTSN